jgi:prolyl-tRNA synthetase
MKYSNSDDRSKVSAGEKFADADLIGIPYRAVVSEKTKDYVEFKERSKGKVNVRSYESFIENLKEEK